MGVLLVASLCVSEGTASAQAAAGEERPVGVAMGYPAAIGVVIRVSERVAIRPDIQFSVSTGSSDASIVLLTSENSTITTGISGLIDIGRWDKLRAYVSPRYAYGRLSATSTSTFATESETRINTHTFMGSFGAEYRLHDRFSAFGEAGIGYSRQTSRADNTDVRNKSNGTSTRTAVGVVYYF